MEYLPNGNVFGGWGENAYFSEYSKPGGEIVYEASFLSHRFANYRTYKGDFVGRPETRPDIKAFATVNSRGSQTTTIYVGWNGATEVNEWRFFAGKSSQSTNGPLRLGTASKTGFETSFVATGYHPIVFAEAVDIYGTRLGRSELETTELPLGFHDEAAPMFTPSRQGFETDLFLYTVVAFIAGITFTLSWGRLQLSKQGLFRRVGSASWGQKRR